MKTREIVISLFVILIIAFSSLNACSAGSTSVPKVVCSTSLLSYIAEQVGGDKIEVINLIPPAQHPGNFNVRPGDIQSLTTAKLFLIHGWPGETFVDKMVSSAGNPNLVLVKISIAGSWMTPPVQQEATDKVAAALSEIDPANASFYKGKALAYKQSIADTDKIIRQKLAEVNAGNINVIAAAMQADFLKWAGMKIVATYPDPNALNPQLIKDLVDKGKASGVKLVIDNLQNGKDAGKAIAEETGARQINLSNFPGGFENTETWEKAVNFNVELIVKALKQNL